MTTAQTRARRAEITSVRTRLLLVALAVAIPLTLLAFARAWERRRSEEQRVTEQARQLAVLAARGLDAQVAGTRTMLQGLSQLLHPDFSPDANDAILRRLFREAPARYATIWINDTTGRNIGAATLPAGGRDAVNLADRLYFKTALATRRFVAGQVVRSRTLAGAPQVMVFAMPVTDSLGGRVSAVVGASVQIDSLEGMQVVRTLPPGSVLTILDSNAVVIWRSVDGEHWIGRNFKKTNAVTRNLSSQEGAGPGVSDDGTHRLVAWRRMYTTGWMVYVGIPTKYSLDIARAQFVRDLATGGIATALVLLFAYFAARHVVAPIESLTVDAVAIANGDEQRRSQIDSRDEIGALANAFNRMADTAVLRRRALADSEARYRVLFDANPLPVFAWSPDSQQLTDANDAALQQYGYARSEFVGQPLRSFILPIDHARLETLLTSLRENRGDGASDGVWHLRHASGRVLEIEIHAAPYQRGDSVEIIVVAIDVGARRAAELALEESREQLRQGQKMEALGSFAGGIAHEFNNYLSSIMGFTELVQSQLPDNSEERADLREALAAATRAAALTRQILVFSRKQVVEAALLNPSEVIRDLERMMRPMLGETVRFSMQLADSLGFIRTDRGQLEQILVNLARNARDAMPAGGEFFITTSRLALRAEDPAHAGVPTGDWIVIAARDTGEGMPDDVRTRIFEPFFTTKARGHGTGLGLALVYSMVQHAGGTVRVESHLGAGTTFFLYFPRSLESQSAPRATPVRPALVGGTESILVVEDDSTVRAMSQLVLARAGYRVSTAPDGASALEVLNARDLTFDLMLTDVVMPGMNGAALAERAREQFPTLKIVFMSGYADDDEIVRNASTDTIAFVAKPFTSDALLRKIREVLDSDISTTAT